MADLNLFGGVVKILEIPKQKILKKKYTLVQCRVQLPQARKNRVVKLKVWGKLAKDVITHYKINDYILVEGYISIRYSLKKDFPKSLKKIPKKLEISALKIYPFILSSIR